MLQPLRLLRSVFGLQDFFKMLMKLQSFQFPFFVIMKAPSNLLKIQCFTHVQSILLFTIILFEKKSRIKKLSCMPYPQLSRLQMPLQRLYLEPSLKNFEEHLVLLIEGMHSGRVSQVSAFLLAFE